MEIPTTGEYESQCSVQIEDRKMNQRCGCEDGDFCTKTTVCRVEAEVADHVSKIELMEPVVKAAVEFYQQAFNGRYVDAITSKKNFFEAVVEYERETT